MTPLNYEKWGSVATWVRAVVALLDFFLRNLSIVAVGVAIVGAGMTSIPRSTRIILAMVAIVIVVIGCLAMMWKREPVFGTFGKTIVFGMVALAMSFLYTNHIPVVLCQVLKDEGNIIARKTEKCILEGVREGDEKVVITLIESEKGRETVYAKALSQAQDKGYIEFIDGRYRTANNWIEVPFAFTEDKTPSEKKLVLMPAEGERNLIADWRKVPLPLKQANAFLSDGQRRRLIRDIGCYSVLLTEGERKVLRDVFGNYEEQDLYDLMHSVLNDANMVTELGKKQVYDADYYELRILREDDPVAEDEEIVRLSRSPVVLRKTTQHLTPYDKIGIIGGFIDELR